MEVQSSREQFWNRTGYQRDYPDGHHEWTVNLLNLDSDLLHPSNEGKPAHQIPPAAFPTTVRWRIPDGVSAESVRAFVMHAEDASLQALELRPSVEGGAVVCQIPPIPSWSMLLIRY